MAVYHSYQNSMHMGAQHPKRRHVLTLPCIILCLTMFKGTMKPSSRNISPDGVQNRTNCRFEPFRAVSGPRCSGRRGCITLLFPEYPQSHLFWDLQGWKHKPNQLGCVKTIPITMLEGMNIPDNPSEISCEKPEKPETPGHHQTVGVKWPARPSISGM